jgi:hypothetical protein
MFQEEVFSQLGSHDLWENIPVLEMGEVSSIVHGV